jgi:TolA-binding protein
MLWQIIIGVIAAASVLSYFEPTPAVLVSSFKSGQTYFVSGDYKKAIEQFDNILDTKSSVLNADSVQVSILSGEFVLNVRSAAYYQKANSMAKLGRYSEAAQNYRHVEQSNDMGRIRPMAQSQLYNLFFKQKQYDSAIVEARHLESTYPEADQASQALFDVGWAFLLWGKRDSASVAFTDLITRYPKSQFDVRARYQIGENYFESGDYQKAIAIFSELVKLNLPEKFDSKAWENVELKAVRDRMKFEAAAGKDEDISNLELVAKASIKIADCYAKMNQYDKALAQYRMVITQYSLMPTLVEISYVKMADLALAVKGIDEAVYVYRRAIDESFGKKDLQAKLQYKIAKTYEDQKIFNKAAEEYAFFMRAYPDVQVEIKFSLEQANLNAVIMFYNALNYRSSIAYADTFQRRFPTSEAAASILLIEGTSYTMLKEYGNARAVLGVIVERFPASDQRYKAQLIIARSYADEKQYDKAIPALIVVRDICPEQIQKDEANFFLIVSYYETQKYEEAMNVFPRIPYGSPFFGPAIGKTSKCFSALKRFDEGKQMLVGIRERAKSDTTNYIAETELALADIYVAESKPDSAIVHLTALLSSTASVGVVKYQTLFARGVLYSLTDKHKESVADLEQVLASDLFKTQLATFVPSATEKLAFSLIQLGNRKRSFELLQKLIDQARTEEEKARFLAMMADALFRAQEYAKGAETAEKIIAMAGLKEETIVRAYSVASKCYAALGNMEKSISYLTIIAGGHAAFSQSEDIVFEFATLLYDNGGLDYASRVFTIYMKYFPNGRYMGSVRLTNAYCLSRIGRIDEAIAQYGAMIKEGNDPTKVPGLLYAVADLYYGKKELERAIKAYRNVYRSYPASPEAARAMYGEAWSYNLIQQPDSMELVLQEMVKKYPKAESAADAYFTIGDYHYNKKEYQEARAAYAHIVSEFPAYPRFEEAKQLVHELEQITAYLEYEKAIALFDAKDYTGAIVELDKVLAKYPGTDIELGCKANIASSYEQLGQFSKAKEMFQKIVDEYRDVAEAFDVTIFAQQHVRWIETKL